MYPSHRYDIMDVLILTIGHLEVPFSCLLFLLSICHSPEARPLEQMRQPFRSACSCLQRCGPDIAQCRACLESCTANVSWHFSKALRQSPNCLGNQHQVGVVFVEPLGIAVMVDKHNGGSFCVWENVSPVF